VQQDGFARSNNDDDADAEAVTDTPRGLETNILSLRLAEVRAENWLLVAKAKELAAETMVPQDVENRPACSCGASLALEAALQQGVKLQSLLREMALKLALATKETEQVSSDIAVVREKLRDSIKSVMRSGGPRDSVKKVPKAHPVFDRLYADAWRRHEKACDVHHLVPGMTGHSCDTADILPTYTEGQSSKPSGHSTDSRSFHSLPSPGPVNCAISLPSRPLSSVGMVSNRLTLGSLTVDDCTVDVGTRRSPTMQIPSMLLALHSHATTEGSRTGSKSSSRPLATHAKPPVRLPQSPPRRRPAQLYIGQLKDSEVTPRKLQSRPASRKHTSSDFPLAVFATQQLCSP